MRYCLTFLIPATFCLADIVRADDITPPASQRYQAADAEETPEFRRHVVPLLSRLGCNGRACHGSFQGQGGFRLSLFGYDFKMDHEGLFDRIDTDVPADSYAIQKPTLVEPHEGGKRLEPGSWEYRVFMNWIKAGAKPFDPEQQAEFVKLDVEPKEILFRKAGESVQLKAVVTWSDGSREDVTPLCRFQSNNEQIAMIDGEGLVTANEPGDSHVVIFYDNGVVPIPVLQPVSNQVGPKYPAVATPTKVDELVVNKLSKLGVVPSDVCTDEEFLRRVTLDITGTLPTPAEVKQFLADSSSNKRVKKIDELLERPAYAAWWATKLCDFTGNNPYELRNILPDQRAPGSQWYEWVYSRVENNTPYDELVAGIVTGSSRLGEESYQEFCEKMTKVLYKDDHQFSDRESMPYFWARRNLRQPEEKALAFAYSFMGIRIQCAQCHKHPFDQWTQDDYNQFTNFFTRVQFGRNPETAKEYRQMMEDLGVAELRGGEQRRELAKLAKKGKVIPLQEVYVREAPKNLNEKARKRNRNLARLYPETAKLLGDEEVKLEDAPDPRVELMEWLRAKDNPYFAKAFVNRVWANYFNVGIVEPPDDLNLANPPSNAELLDWLAAEFVNQNYDMKWLHRTIANSATYQRSWKPNATNELDERNFSRAVPRRLPAEVTIDALKMAAANDERNEQFVRSIEDRSISGFNYARTDYALDIFGRSTRESNCDCDRSMEASLLQTIYLRNDSETQRLLQDNKGWIEQIYREYAPQGNNRSVDEAVAKRLKTRLKAAEQQHANMLKKLTKLKDRDPDNPRIPEGEKRIAQMEQQMKKVRDQLGLNKPQEKKTEEPKFDAEKIVTEAYLRTLSRYPKSEELATASQYLTSSEDLRDGLEGLMWALLNTKEFIVNH
ncbi:MAG: DUF1549 domain-containing protein [Planctomycetaceae bacterium]|nr:DUF1549 domain-containing protein [Planctomycetaceae bacterium]